VKPRGLERLALPVAAAASLFFAFPLLWAGLTALRPAAELWNFPPWLPSRPEVGSFARVLAAPGFLRSLGNSVLLGAWGTALSLACALPGAYALARARLPGRGALMLALLAFSLLPPVSLSGGLYRLFSDAGLINNLWALAVPLAALQLPFLLWLLTAAISRVPRSLEEAAWIDGCGRAQAVARVLLPALGGPLASAGLLALAFFWNEFLLTLILTFDAHARTATVAVALLQGSYEQPWGELCAAAVLAAAPLLLLALLFQRRLVSGLTAGFSSEG
jgi:ABC-type glycerol-3-phosphate transport system permease component